MTAPMNAWQQHQLRCWLRPNNDLYWHPDAARYLPEQLHYLLPPQLRSLAKSADGVYRPNVVQGTGQRGRWTPDDDTALKAEQQRRAAASMLKEIDELKSTIAKIRYDLAFERFKRAFLRGAYAERPRGKAGFRPDQPRLPSGNPDGGQWAREGGSSRARFASSEKPKLGPGTISIIAAETAKRLIDNYRWPDGFFVPAR